VITPFCYDYQYKTESLYDSQFLGGTWYQAGSSKTRFLLMKRVRHTPLPVSRLPDLPPRKENVQAKQIKELIENDMGTEHQIDGAMQRKES